MIVLALHSITLKYRKYHFKIQYDLTIWPKGNQRFRRASIFGVCDEDSGTKESTSRAVI